jgi:hypothetical protein
MQRKVGWYIFGYLAVIAMFALSVILYGDPINDTDGILPWKPIPEWNTASVMSYMVVSLTFTGTTHSSPLLTLHRDLLPPPPVPPSQTQ